MAFMEQLEKLCESINFKSLAPSSLGFMEQLKELQKSFQ